MRKLKSKKPISIYEKAKRITENNTISVSAKKLLDYVNKDS